MDYIHACEIYSQICLKNNCNTCPIQNCTSSHNFGCDGLFAEFPEEILPILKQWEAEHPIKTCRQDFLEKHPSALVRESGIPAVCAELVGYGNLSEKMKTNILNGHGGTCNKSCADCWNTPNRQLIQRRTRQCTPPINAKQHSKPLSMPRSHVPASTTS